MNRKQLIERIAHDTEMSKAGAERALASVLNGIADALVDGKDVTLVGFGTFSTKERAERAGRNPQTGEPITIAAAKKASFKPSKELNARLGEG